VRCEHNVVKEPRSARCVFHIVVRKCHVNGTGWDMSIQLKRKTSEMWILNVFVITGLQPSFPLIIKKCQISPIPARGRTSPRSTTSSFTSPGSPVSLIRLVSPILRH